MTAEPRFRFRPHVEALHPNLGVNECLAALSALPGLAVLDSAGGSPARYSLLAFAPLYGAAPPETVAGLRSYFAALERAGGDRVPGPFHGGFLGALAYDLGAAGERQALPTPAWPVPPIVGGLYTDFIVIEHGSGKAWLVLGDAPGDGRPSLADRRAAVLDRLATPPVAGDDDAAHGTGPLVRHVDGAEHQRRIQRAREWIGEGEFYQANLAHRFTRRVVGHPVRLYQRLREVNPAPYMAYLAFQSSGGTGDAGALLSASPELLFELLCEPNGRRGRRVRTRPIKGTIERGLTPEADAAQRAALLASEKDRAELSMIVDLERNDLGRVARTGTVRVGEFPALESYAALHHLVADVSCELRPGLDAVDVLAALFPGGSITGAPKLRAMEAIAALEVEGRGFFTGSLGYVDTRGQAAFNILIRTLVWRGTPAAGGPGEVSFHVGGGITIGSDAEAEERETLTKGAALAAALSGRDEPLDTLGVPVPDLGAGALVTPISNAKGL